MVGIMQSLLNQFNTSYLGNYLVRFYKHNKETESLLCSLFQDPEIVNDSIGSKSRVSSLLE